MEDKNKDIEKTYEVSFQIILHAGDARSNAARAVEAANSGKFQEAEDSLKAANQELKQAHKIQTQLIQREANGDSSKVNLMMIHAQDHFTMALMSIDQAKQMIRLCRRLDALEHPGKKEK